MSKCTVIFNPQAGRGAYRRKLPKLREEFRSAGMNGDIYIVEDKHAISREVKTHIGDSAVIVAAGGDGTINAVVQSLLTYEKRPPLGIIPLGTGNDYSRGLGIPRRARAAASVLKTGRVCHVDVGKVQWTEQHASEEKQHYFVNALGFGIEAFIAERVHDAGYQSWLKSYATTLLRALRNWKSTSASVWYTNESREAIPLHHGPLLAGTISNGPTSGGGFRLSPNASLSDGTLDLFLIPPRPVKRIVRMLPWLAVGKHGYFPDVIMCQAGKFEIRSEEGISFHVDGELLGRNATRASISLLSEELAVICP